MKLKGINLFLVLILVFGVLFSQNPEWVNFKSYGSHVLAVAIEGNYVWVGTSGGLVRLDRTTGAMTFYNRSNSGLPSNYVYSIAIDGQGNKWIGTWFRGLAMFDGSRWKVYNMTNSGLPIDIVHSIAIDKQGNKWIGTYGGGLAMFDGSRWTVYNTTNSGLPDNDVLSIAIDGQGNKWIGTWGGGLAVYREGGVILNVQR